MKDHFNEYTICFIKGRGPLLVQVDDDTSSVKSNRAHMLLNIISSCRQKWPGTLLVAKVAVALRCSCNLHCIVIVRHELMVKQILLTP